MKKQSSVSVCDLLEEQKPMFLGDSLESPERSGQDGPFAAVETTWH